MPTRPKCKAARAIVPFLLLWIVVSLAAGRAEEAANYRGPCAVAASRDGKTLYVANADGREVARVELPAGTVTRRIAVPAEPTGLVLSPDSARLIVTCASPKSTVAMLASPRSPWAPRRDSPSGDAGVLRGSGIETTQRAYWSNKAAGLVSDIPSEAELTPQLWGWIEFQR